MGWANIQSIAGAGTLGIPPTGENGSFPAPGPRVRSPGEGTRLGTLGHLLTAAAREGGLLGPAALGVHGTVGAPGMLLLPEAGLSQRTSQKERKPDSMGGARQQHQHRDAQKGERSDE